MYDHAPNPDPRPIIDIEAGELPRTLHQVAEALHSEVFLRGGQIVHLVRDGDPGEPGGPQMTIRSVDRDLMRVLIAQQCRLRKPDARSRDGWREVDPPFDVATGLLALADSLPFRRLRGVVRSPLVRRDGSLVTKPGYDPDTSLYCDFEAELVDGMSPTLCKAAAVDAYRELTDLLKTFPFVAEADRSVAISAILTALQRPVLPSAPLHGFDSPTPGTGKTKLSTIAAVIATGRPGAVVSLSNHEEETNKRLDGILLAGTPIMVIDNIEAPLGGDKLCSALTEPALSLRPLGGSAVVRAPVTTMFMATGNNLRLKGDITRRALIARLDAREERPELRTFSSDPVVDAITLRSDLIRAALTMILAYHQAGRPGQRSEIGSFGAWCRVVRDPLTWVGAADPVSTMERLREDDPVLSDLLCILECWRARHGSEPRQLSEVISDAIADDSDLQQTLFAVAGTARGEISAKRLASYFRRYKDRIVGGMRITQCGKVQGTARWRLDTITEG